MAVKNAQIHHLRLKIVWKKEVRFRTGWLPDMLIQNIFVIMKQVLVSHYLLTNEID